MWRRGNNNLQNNISMYNYNATCTRVVDGDTVDAMIDLGFGVHVKKRYYFQLIFLLNKNLKEYQVNTLLEI